MEEQLHNTDHTDDQFDSIAPNTQNAELQDEAISNEDLHLTMKTMSCLVI